MMFTSRKHRVRTSIYDVDDDTLVEILNRLSTIKHMVSCKLVSKLWCTLISNFCIPKTISSSSMYGMLFNSGPNPATGIKGPWSFACLNGVKPNTSLVASCLGSTLPFSPFPSDFLDCCNGMLLFFDRSSMHYYVCNPSTQQYVRIPNSLPQNMVPQSGTLIFDPHYKVVHIVHPPSHALAINIFSPATHKWDIHQLSLESSIALSRWVSRSIFFDGSVYRLSLSRHLLQFGVRQIGCRAIKLPTIPVRTDAFGCLGVSLGSLHYAWRDQSSQIMIWKFVEDGQIGEWLLKNTIYLRYIDNHPLCSDLHSCSPFSVFAFHPTSDLLFIGNLAGIFSYDTDTKRLENICKLTEDKCISGGYSLVFPFSVNLNPLDTFKQNTTEESSANRWQPPPAEFLKVNFGAAFDSESEAAAGAAIVRDCSEAVLACTYRKFESFTAEEAESKAALMAIETAMEINAVKVMFEGDALNLMLALNREDKRRIGWQAWYSFQRRILMKHTAFSDVRFSWVRREMNNTAHELAQWALNGNGSPPRFTEFSVKPLSVV